MKTFQQALAFIVCILVPLTHEAAELRTSDGLRLQFANNGAIQAVSVGNAAVTENAEGGILARGAGANSFVPMRGSLIPATRGFLLYSKSDRLGLEVTTEFQNRGEYISVEGTVKNPSGKDRCVDLKVELPVDARGWRWGKGLSGEAIVKDSAVGEKTSDDVTMYPVATISSTNSGTGLAIAVPPNHPTLFDTGADKYGLFVIFRIGLAPDSAPANETKFRAIIFRHDAEWGFRSALDRYYNFFRDPYFVRRVKKIGAWAWHNPPPADMANSKLYAFHEAGGEIWKTGDQGMHGYEHEGKNLAATVGDFEQLAKLSSDEQLGIYSLPYTIVGQRQVYHLPKLPKNQSEALAFFESWKTDEPIVFQCPGPSTGFRSVDQLKEVIRRSCLYDQDQKPIVMMRQYLGNTVTFPLNPNPNLFSDSDAVTIARYTMDDYLPMLFTGSKYFDGCYVDSLGRWPAYFNFRREHFRYSTVPLTYSATTKAGANDEDVDPAEQGIASEPSISAPQPCLWSLQSHAEYLWQLSRRLHAQNKIVFANGIHRNRVMLGFAVDALGCEGVPSYRSGEGYYSARVAAYQKPYCSLNGRDSVNPVAWNSCLYLGILIGSRSDKGQELERKYLPAMIRINEAGWEPVTYASADKSAVGVERWGKGNGLYFTAMNRSKQPVETRLQLDIDGLHLGRKVKATDLITGAALDTESDKHNVFVKLSLEAEQAVAIAVK